ncbi:uncharacterized protein LOC144356704 [Saccoglossus kowalevskii]
MVLGFIFILAVSFQCEAVLHQSCAQKFNALHYKVKCGEPFGTTVVMECHSVQSDKDVKDAEVYHVSPSGRMNLTHRVQNKSGVRCYRMYCLDVHIQSPYVFVTFTIGKIGLEDIATYELSLKVSSGLKHQGKASFNISLEHDNESCTPPPPSDLTTEGDVCADGKKSACVLTCPQGYTLNSCNICSATNNTDEIEPELFCEMKETCDCDCNTRQQRQCCRINEQSCGCKCCSKKKKRKCRKEKMSKSKGT